MTDVRVSPSGAFEALPPSSTVVPLTRTFWVDAGRVGSTQDGSIAQPFLTVQAAVDAAFPLSSVSVATILICPGAVYTSQDVSINADADEAFGQLNLIGLGGSYQAASFARPAIKLGDVLAHLNFEGAPPICELRGFACEFLTVIGGVVLTDVLPDDYDLSDAEVVTDAGTVQLLRQVTGDQPTGGFTLPTCRKGVVFAVPAIVTSQDVTVTLAFPAVRVGDTFSVAPAGALPIEPLTWPMFVIKYGISKKAAAPIQAALLLGESVTYASNIAGMITIFPILETGRAADDMRRALLLTTKAMGVLH